MMHQIHRGHKGIHKTMETMHEAVTRLHWWHSVRAVGSSAQPLPGRLQVAESIAEGDQLKAGPQQQGAAPTSGRAGSVDNSLPTTTAR